LLVTAIPPDREVFRVHYEDEKSRRAGTREACQTLISQLSTGESNSRNEHVQSILDVGCGDGQSSKCLNLSGVRYMGLDLAPSVIAKNAEQYESPTVKFSIAPNDISTIAPVTLRLAA
jgi:2-polyprenyl-3-methyl-5-hydroxy-6-metoxy-1,4-benzoquinol methylase